jgi:hypothetical protein
MRDTCAAKQGHQWQGVGGGGERPRCGVGMQAVIGTHACRQSTAQNMMVTATAAAQTSRRHEQCMSASMCRLPRGACLSAMQLRQALRGTAWGQSWVHYDAVS